MNVKEELVKVLEANSYAKEFVTSLGAELDQIQKDAELASKHLIESSNNEIAKIKAKDTSAADAQLESLVKYIKGNEKFMTTPSERLVCVKEAVGVVMPTTVDTRSNELVEALEDTIKDSEKELVDVKAQIKAAKELLA